MIKHINNDCPDDHYDFIESVEKDIDDAVANGVENIQLSVGATMNVGVGEEDDKSTPLRKIDIAIQLTNVDELDDDTCNALASMLNALLDDNNIRIFDYEARNVDEARS